MQPDKKTLKGSMQSLVKTKNGLYGFLLILTVVGYAWLFINYLGMKPVEKTGFTFCLFKQASGLACPACGTTRSMLTIMQGAMEQALYLNPFGLILLSVMLVTPIWILWDLLTGNDSFLSAFQSFEKWMNQKGVLIPFMVLVLLNWIWNIVKGL